VEGESALGDAPPSAWPFDAPVVACPVLARGNRPPPGVSSPLLLQATTPATSIRVALIRIAHVIMAASRGRFDRHAVTRLGPRGIGHSERPGTQAGAGIP
jgi:hypothetical protein